MKALLWLPAVFIAGIVIGAWGPREEIRALKANPQETVDKRRRAAADGFQAFARLANIPDEASRPHRRKPADKPLFKAATNKPPVQAVTPVKVNPVPLSGAKTGTVAKVQHPRPERLSPEDLRARIEEAQDLWRTRVTLAVAQWKEKLAIEGAAAERFDAAIDSMNEQLYDTMQAMAQTLSQQERMTPELGLRMMGDATTILAETYEKIGACVPPERRAEVSEMQVFDFIDPGVAEPLISVQGKLDGMNLRGTR